MPQLTTVSKLLTKRCSCSHGKCLQQFQGQEQEIQKIRVDFQKSLESVKDSFKNDAILKRFGFIFSLTTLL